MLALINMELIERYALGGEVASIEEDQEADWRWPVFEYISQGKLPQEKSQAH